MWEKGSEKAVHVKEDRNGRISVEVQFPDPSANPYLALTAILAAGLEGIEKALVLDEEAGAAVPGDIGDIAPEAGSE